MASNWTLRTVTCKAESKGLSNIRRYLCRNLEQILHSQ